MTDSSSSIIYDLNLFTFSFIGQFFGAEQMVIVPLDSFKRLAEEAGDPGTISGRRWSNK
jgi:hypothetical protein